MNQLPFRNILCVRADNMGDVIMSGPAIRALKETFSCTITLLTSTMGSLIVPCMPEVDDVLVYDLPFVKAHAALSADGCMDLVQQLKQRQFDAAVIFTTYSQSPLPAAMLLFMAGIPVRLGWCRENPYALLTHWIPDKEPYTYIIHQVQRDLELVSHIGATTVNDQLSVQCSPAALQRAMQKLSARGIDTHEPWIIVHTGVSEQKREYPTDRWIRTIQMLQEQYTMPILLTGATGDRAKAEYIQQATGEQVYVVAGLFDIEEFAAVIQEALLVISVNTATVHIAAATQTPVVVLYALTNPQHTPWRAYARVLPFEVPSHLKSRNEVIGYVNEHHFNQPVPFPSPEDIAAAAAQILEGEMSADSLGSGILNLQSKAVDSR